MDNNRPFLALTVPKRKTLVTKILAFISCNFRKDHEKKKTDIEILETKIIDLVNENTTHIVYGFMSGKYYKKRETITNEDFVAQLREEGFAARLKASFNQDMEKIKNLTVEDFLNGWFYRHRLNPHFNDQVMHLAFSHALGKFLYAALGENFLDFCAKVSTLGYEHMDFAATIISLIARQKAFEEKMLKDIEKAKASGWRPSAT